MLRHRTTRLLAAAGALALGAALLGASPAVAQGAAEPDVEIIATGLNSPRHLTFSPGGALYVAEAGTGGPTAEAGGNCHPLTAAASACLGATGSIAQITDHGVERVVTGLPSVANDSEAIGPFDIAFTGNHRFAITIGLGGSPEHRDAFGTDGKNLGTIVTGSLKPQHSGGRISLAFDAVAHEDAHSVDTPIDSNPTGLALSGNGYVYLDAGGNSLVSTRKGGTTVAGFSPLLTTQPGPTPIGFPADAVPSDVVQGPDGAWYVSQLVGFPFEKGSSTIWRVAPGHAPEPYATGLTNVTSLAFAKDGRLYAVELATSGLLNGPIGALREIAPGSDQHEIIAGGLDQPYGLAIRDGDAYLTLGAAAPVPGGGSVVRIGL